MHWTLSATAEFGPELVYHIMWQEPTTIPSSSCVSTVTWEKDSRPRLFYDDTYTEIKKNSSGVQKQNFTIIWPKQEMQPEMLFTFLMACPPVQNQQH